MSNTEDDDDQYGDIADEDLIAAFSQASQALPLLPSPSRRHPSFEDDASDTRKRRRSRTNESGGSGEEGEDEGRAKKNKYRIHIGEREVPAGKILGATQAEALPDSSPYRIRGPIYMKPRPEPPEPPPSPQVRHMVSTNTALQRRIDNQQHNDRYIDEFDDIPSDAFSSPEGEFRDSITIPPSSLLGLQENTQPRRRLAAPLQGLRQTTLFGGRAPEEVSASQANKVHNFIVDLPPEAPTHHTLDQEALKTWVYPTNLGKIRDYQYSIVRHALFHNTLVALPTGLGKTFIAATVMYNYYRWTKNAQIIFVAPTKPLVAQQVDACFNLVGIPKSQTTMLTGEQAPALRAEEWQDKRVFFMTPQTLENDLSSGIADPKKIVLLVVDEAHRATGNYAYVKVVTFLRRFNKSFRVLALTATPGASVESVQEVVDGLEIAKVEIRTEDSIDIKQYVHQRNIEQHVLDPSDEMLMVQQLFGKALQPLVDQLCGQNAHWNRDPMALTAYGMMQSRKAWMASGAARTASQGLKYMMFALFSTLASVAHSIKLLNFHGIGPFYASIKDFRRTQEEAKGGGKYKAKILEHPEFKKMMDRIQMWLSNDNFVGHPKLTYLCDTILNHFMDAGEGRLGENAPPSATRVIVFSEFRDSAEDITRVLNRHQPMIRASVFVGQADSKRSEGMNQAKQIDTIDKFKSGKINVIVATSIGEEGLDIGQVDLIVCYDASSSPIRMLQRMGRTGRKRAGNITLLLMRGKEEDQFAKAKDNYEQMQKMISSGARFNFRHDLSVRILPRDIMPEVDKRHIEIPPENTQDPSLPEPKRRRGVKSKKKPPKKFHMPDGVETGFQKASKLGQKKIEITDLGITVKHKETSNSGLTPVPSLDSVLLSETELGHLKRRYQDIYTEGSMQEVSTPALCFHPLAQRSLRRTVRVSHGDYTKRNVTLFRTLGESQSAENRDLLPYGDQEPDLFELEMLIFDNDLKARAPPKPAAVVVAPRGPIQAKKKKKTPPVKAKKSPPKRRKLSNRPSLNNPPSSLQFVGRPSSSPPPDSEGEGDDCLSRDETSGHDSDASLGSLKDFLASDGHLSLVTCASSQVVMNSLTLPSSLDRNPSSRPERRGKREEVTIEIDDCDSDESSEEEEDGQIRQMESRKHARRFVVDEDDSDE